MWIFKSLYYKKSYLFSYLIIYVSVFLLELCYYDFHYLLGTSKISMDIQNFKLIGYTDSDFAGSIDDRKNTSWYVFSFGSGWVAWASKKQSTLTISYAESEYVVVTTTACQTVWMRRNLSELQHEQIEPTQFFLWQ